MEMATPDQPIQPHRTPVAGKAFPPEISIARQLVLVGALLLLYIFQAVSAATRESNTFDEPLHLTTGYLYWTHPEEKLWPENGLFAQAWAALPLLFDHLNMTPTKEIPPEKMAQWDQGNRFFYLMGNDPDKMLFQGRAMISLLGAGLGALVFYWSRQLFGTGAGFISLLLYIFCPTMLAHGALVSADMAAALGFFAATLCFWNLSHTVSIPHFVLSVLALGCLMLAKMSSLLIGPIFFLILIVRLFSSRPTKVLFFGSRTYFRWGAKAGIGGLLLLANAFAAIALLWLAYNFNYRDWGEEASRHQVLSAPGFTLLSANGMKASCLETLSEIHLLPPAYLEGLTYQLNNSQGNFLWGRYYEQGSIWFFPLAFLIKTPISTLLFFLLSLVAYGSWRNRESREKITGTAIPARCPSAYDLSPLLILGGVYGVACLSSSLNIGQRHLLPVYPVLFVLAGANVFWLRHAGLIFRTGLGVLLAGVIIESLSIRPHYLAFFNQLVGGPRHGYRYLVDSSLDWGQDLPGLRQWLEKNAPAGGNANVYLSYFGTGNPEYYGIQSLRLPDRFSIGSPEPFPWTGGIYCISATRLQGGGWSPATEHLYQQVEKEKDRWDATTTDPAARASLLREKGTDYWNSYLVADRQLKFVRLCIYLRQREPDDEVGYSILIYRLSNEDVWRALEGSPSKP